jgi:hypothetical protein
MGGNPAEFIGLNEELSMIERFIKRLLPLVLIAAISAIGVTATIHTASAVTTQPALIALVKTMAKKKVKIDPAVAKATIAQLLSKIDKTPEQPIVRRTSIEGNYAVATWTWGEAGGQSILTKKQGRWQVLSSGGGAVNLATLKEVGIPEQTARVLMQQEAAAPKK